MVNYTFNRGRIDWLGQRYSALFLLIALSTYLIFFLYPHHLSFTVWHQFFFSWPIVTLTSISLIAIGIHSWVGIWTVITDYVTNTLVQHMLIIMLKWYVISITIGGIFFIAWLR